LDSLDILTYCKVSHRAKISPDRWDSHFGMKFNNVTQWVLPLLLCWESPT
jgi:hypothetical protein